MRFENENDYISYLKKKTKYAWQHNKIDMLLSLWEARAKIRHSYNSVFYDEELENEINSFADSFLKRVDISKPNRKVVFYDSVFSDFTVLSRQYLKALIDMNIEFKYIARLHNSIDESSKLIKLAETCANCDLVLIKPSEQGMQLVERIRGVIRDALPEIILIQTTISDATGIAALSNICGTKRFFINHGDDQFWLGANEFEYYIHFSDSVREIAKFGRKIPDNKSVVLKYYPVIEHEDFKGFPAGIEEDDFIVFSGGRFSKTIDSSYTYYNLIKKILDEHKNIKFVYAGSGNGNFMKHYIKANNLENRWIVTSYRKDLFEFLRRVKIYIGTFPVKGGLMTQYAAYAQVPILEIEDNTGFRSEELFIESDDLHITFSDVESLIKEFEKLVTNAEYRRSISALYKDRLMTPELFATALQKIFFEGNKEVEKDHGVRLDKILEYNSLAFSSNKAQLYRAMINKNIALIDPATFIKFSYKYYVSLDVRERKSLISKVYSLLRR